MPGIATGDRAEEKGGGLLPRLGQDTGLHSGQPASDLDGMTEYISTQKVLGAGLFRCVNLACCCTGTLKKNKKSIALMGNVQSVLFTHISSSAAHR